MFLRSIEYKTGKINVEAAWKAQNIPRTGNLNRELGDMQNVPAKRRSLG